MLFAEAATNDRLPMMSLTCAAAASATVPEL
jgi:hypothetical protein